MKRLISASLLSFVATQTLFATSLQTLVPGLKSVLQRKEAQAITAKPAMKVTKSANTMFHADFSGKWVGRCQGTDAEEFDEIKLDIEDDQNGITINGLGFAPDEVRGISNNSKDVTDSALVAMEWVDNDQVLLFKIGGSELVRTASGYTMSNFHMTSKLSLEAGQLKQETSFKYFLDGQESQGEEVCTYKKQ